MAAIGALAVGGVVAASALVGGRGVAALSLAGAALVAAVAALWSSLHALAEEGPEAEPEAPTLARIAADDELEAVLRAILDLDHEAAVGKILPDDEAPLRAELRAEAKRLLRVQDARIRPEARARAEAIVAEAIAKSQEKSS